MLLAVAAISLGTTGAHAQYATPSSPPFPTPVLIRAALPRDAASPDGMPRVDASDNRGPAGRLAAGVLTVTLEARAGVWHPGSPWPIRRPRSE